jgi:general secretion pathway protein C
MGTQLTNWTGRFQSLRERVAYSIKNDFIKKWNKENLNAFIQNLDPQSVIEWASKTFQKRGASFYGTLATLTLSTYFTSDLAVLVVEEYIPEPISSGSRNSRFGGNTNKASRKINDLSRITTRNLFNSKGLIPGEDANESSGSITDLGGAAVKSSLPLNLIGTLIMSDETRSIGTIEDKAASTVYPVRVDDEIPGKIQVMKIEPRRVTFMNKASGRKEYIESADDSSSLTRPTTIKSSGAGIEKVSATQFNISRSEVDRALSDINNILTQARAVPNFENGVAAGYKLFQIVPGSIYDKLGLQNGDVIFSANGQAITDPAKAFEMVSELKSSNHMELQIKKDGKLLNYNYDIH